MQFLPALFPDHRRQRVVLVALGCCVVQLGAAPWAAAQTVDQAKAYFKDFDDHTLRRTGEFVNKIYGVTDPTDQAQLDAAAEKLGKDIFDGFASAAGRAVQLEALQAHGKPVNRRIWTRWRRHTRT